MLEKHYTALFADENILYFNEDSDDAKSFCNNMSIPCLDFNNINFHDNFDEDYPDFIIAVRLLA